LSFTTAATPPGWQLLHTGSLLSFFICCTGWQLFVVCLLLQMAPAPHQLIFCVLVPDCCHAFVKNVSNRLMFSFPTAASTKMAATPHRLIVVFGFLQQMPGCCFCHLLQLQYPEGSCTTQAGCFLYFFALDGSSPQVVFHICFKQAGCYFCLLLPLE